MKNIVIKYDNIDRLEELINKSYFDNDNNGKIRGNNSIKVESSVLKTILSDMEEYEIKIENEILDGVMNFKTKQDGEDLYLIPTSIYCIKSELKSDSKIINKYSFY